MNKTLYFFTDTFPYGAGQEWKFHELRALSAFFENLIVIPFASNDLNYPEELIPKGVTLLPPLFKENPMYQRYSLFERISATLKLPLHIVTREFLTQKVFLSKPKSSSFLQSNIYIKKLIDHPVIKQIIQEEGKIKNLYFFWGKGSCEFSPFISKNKNRIFIRMHGFDLYEDRNNGYFPYRNSLLKTSDAIILVSQHGRKHLSQNFPEYSSKYHLFRLGTTFKGISNPSKDGILRIASCGRVVALKRYHLIAEALNKIEIPIHWHHLGDGPLLLELKERALSLNKNISTFFHGWIPAKDVKSFYIRHPIDLFISVSETEGVPVSIMEAFSCGIPALATDVGGTSEIVDEQVGKLLPKDVTPSQLAFEILNFARNDLKEIIKYRDSAYNRFKKTCDASTLASELSHFIYHFNTQNSDRINQRD